jgi:hypothetical protein
MKRWTKVILIVVGILIVLGFGSNFIAEAAFSKVISGLNEKESFPYNIEYRKTRFDVLVGKFHVFDIKVKKKDPSTKPMFHLEVGAVKISGLDFLDIFNNTYKVNTIKIENPNFSLYSIKDTSAPAPADSSIKFNLKGQMPHLVWKDLKLIRGSIKTYKIVGTDTNRVVNLEGLNFDLGRNNVRTMDDLISHGQFTTKAISFDVGNGSKIYIMESFVDLEKKRFVLRDILFGNEYKHERFFKNIKEKALWKEVSLDSVEFNNILFDHRNDKGHLQLGALNVYKPIILLKNSANLPEPEKLDTFDITKAIPKWIGFDTLKITQGKFEYRDYYKKNKFKYSKVGNIEVRLNRSGWNDNNASRFSKEHYFGGGYINVSNIEAQVKTYSTLKIADLKIDFDSDKVELENLEIKNRVDPKTYVSRQIYKEDWHHMTCESVLISGVNLQRFILKDSLLVNSVDVNRIALDTRTAGDINREPSKVAPLMHNWFKAIPGYHDVKKVRITNGDLKFTMLYDKATQSGTLHLRNINATVDRVTNMNKKFVTTVAGYASYQGQNNLNLLVKIPVQDPNYKFTLKGDARSIDLPALNHFIQPMQLKFLKGRLHMLRFSYNSTDLAANATGKLVFHYDGLKLEVLRSQKKINSRKEKLANSHSDAKVKEDNWVLSTAVNMAAKTKNMPNEKGYVVGVIDHHRYLYQGFFGHMTGCMMQGAQYCLFKTKDKEQKKLEKEERKRRKKKKRSKSR